MDAPDKRRGRATDEHKGEAARLLAIYNEKKALRESRGAGTQAAFGQIYGIGNQAAVGFFLSGKTALSLKAAKGFALGLDVNIADFSPRLASLAADYGSLAGSKPDWPFEYITAEQWGGLSDKWKGVIEDAAIEKLRQLRELQQVRDNANDEAEVPSRKRQAKRKA